MFEETCRVWLQESLNKAQAKTEKAEAEKGKAEAEVTRLAGLLEAAELRQPVKVLSASEISDATTSFDAAKQIGSGGFATVFRADALPSLSIGAPFAVKRLAPGSSEQARVNSP